MRLIGQISSGIKRLAQPRPVRERGLLPLADALPALVPKVRPRFHYETAALKKGGAGPAFRPLAGSFAMGLTVDGLTWELDVSDRELQAWGADFDLLMVQARTNLLRRGGAERFRPMAPGLHRSTWQDSLDGSRVLLPGMIKGLALRGEPVVVLPDRDTLLVAGSEDPEALDQLLERALHLAGADGRSANGSPLRLRNFQWEPWEPGPGHDAAPLLARIRRRRLLEEYTVQKTILDYLHRRSGRAVAVAPFQLERTGTSTVLPTGGLEGWLPEVDRVVLKDGGFLPWAGLRQELGDLLQPLGLFPERYRIPAGVAALLA